MIQRRTAVLGLVAAISFMSGGWFLDRQGPASVDTRQKARLFQQVLQYVSQYYVDSVDAGQLYDMAIDGMLDRLDDPYTSFLRREAFGELSISTTGNYGGVGLRIDLRDGWVTVATPIPNTPGERAGLQSGDQIVEINKVSTKGWDTSEAAQVLRGEPGTDVGITVMRPGYRDSLQFTLTRDQIHVNSVEGAQLLDPGIGYLRLVTVSESSAREVREAITDLRTQGAESIVFDLRDNPGGVLNQGVALADLFLNREDVVVETRGRAPGQSEVFRAQMSEMWPDMPVVVLVNQFTASAAEILAGALQDHDRAVVMGVPTFGKGVAYLLIRLTETEAVTVTSSRWFTPSGRSIQRIPRGEGGQLIAGLAPEAVTDTSRIFYTMGGREVKAGAGGIQPDVLVPRDTLTDAEKQFAQALGSNVPLYRNVLSRYALELKGENTVNDPNFAVTDAMYAEILRRLREAGIEISESDFNAGRDLIGDTFAPEVVRYVFGRDAELRRLALRDSRIQRAVDLLRLAGTSAELFAAAGQTSPGPQ